MTSADPTIQYPDNIQSYNRYSYLNNNPLLAPDLSGYGFEDNKDFLTGVHLVLTGASFCPSACGSVFSLVDSAVYLAEGNGKEASIGLAAAIGGIVTDAGAVKLTIKAADAGLDAVKTAKMGEEAVEATQRIVQTERSVGAEKGLIEANKVRTSELIPTQPLTKSRKQMERLGKEIDEAGGIKEPLKYVEVDGKKFLVDGHHRRAHAQRRGIEEVPAEKVQLPYKGYKTEKNLEYSQY